MGTIKSPIPYLHIQIIQFWSPLKRVLYWTHTDLEAALPRLIKARLFWCTLNADLRLCYTCNARSISLEFAFPRLAVNKCLLCSKWRHFSPSSFPFDIISTPLLLLPTVTRQLLSTIMGFRRAY